MNASWMHHENASWKCIKFFPKFDTTGNEIGIRTLSKLIALNLAVDKLAPTIDFGILFGKILYNEGKIKHYVLS